MKSMEIYGFRTLNSELCTQNNCIIHPSPSSTRPYHPPVPIIHPSPSSTRPHHPPVPSSKPNLGHNILASKKTVGIEFTTFFSIHKVYDLLWCVQIMSLSKDFCQNLLVSTGGI